LPITLAEEAAAQAEKKAAAEKRAEALANASPIMPRQPETTQDGQPPAQTPPGQPVVPNEAQTTQPPAKLSEDKITAFHPGGGESPGGGGRYGGRLSTPREIDPTVKDEGSDNGDPGIVEASSMAAFDATVVALTEEMGQGMEELMASSVNDAAHVTVSFRDWLLDEIARKKIIESGDPSVVKIIDLTGHTKSLAEVIGAAYATMGMIGIADAYEMLKAAGIEPDFGTSLLKTVKRLVMRRGYRARKALNPDKAVDFFSSRTPVPSSVYATMTEEARVKSFAVAGIETSDMARVMELHLIEAIDNGWVFDAFRNAVLLDPKMQQSAPLGGWSSAHLETVFRTNVMTAYNAGRWTLYNDPDVKDYVVAYRYNAILDSRTRPEHAAMDGKVFLASDPTWQTWWPPNGFNCRCTIEPMSRDMTFSLSEQLPLFEGATVQPDLGFGGMARAMRG